VARKGGAEGWREKGRVRCDEGGARLGRGTVHLHEPDAEGQLTILLEPNAVDLSYSLPVTEVDSVGQRADP
jgi:hypothetical protein